MAGKTNSRWVRVLVDDMTPTLQDISASVRSVGNVGLKYDESDVTAYSDGVKNVTLGMPDAPVELSGPFDNTAATGAHTVMSAIVGDETITHTLNVKIGIKAAPTSPDPYFGGEYLCSSYQINGDSGMWKSKFRPASSVAPAWGTL